MTDSHGSGGAAARPGMISLDQLQAAAGCGRDRHGDARLHRHAGPAPGQAPVGGVLPRRGSRALRGGLQLPARGGRGHEHRRRVRDVLLGARLRRLRAQARPDDHAPPAVAAGHRPGTGRPDLAGRRARDRLAAPDPAGSDRPAGRARLGGPGRHRARVRRLPRQLRAGRRQGLSEPGPRQPVQRRLLDPRHVQDRPAAAPDHRRHVRGRPVRRVGQGRVQPRPARDRVPLRRRGHHLRQPLDLQDRGEGDRGPGRHVADLHGQAEPARGQLLPHSPVAARAGLPARAGRQAGPERQSVPGRRRAVRAVAGSASTSWPASWPRCAS